MPEISVIIPAYNQGHYLGEALESLLRQTMPDFEAIIVDDGSTDSTADVARSFSDRRFRYFYQDNRGLSAARNTGIRAAQGAYLTFLDSDDRFLPNKLSLLRSVFAQQPELGLAAGQAVLIDQNSRPLDNPFQSKPLRQPQDLLLGNPFHVGSVLVRRTWQEKAGFFDENLRSYEDWDLWLRLARIGCPFQLIDQPVSQYRFHTAQMTRNGPQMTQATFYVLDKTFSDGSLPAEWQSMQEKAYAHANLRGAAQAFLAKDDLLAKKYLTQAVQLLPELSDNHFSPLAKRFAAWVELPKAQDPIAFLEHIYDHLPARWTSLQNRKAEEVSQAAMRLGYTAYQAGQYRAARGRFMTALRYQPARITNRGLTVTLLKSIVRSLVPRRRQTAPETTAAPANIP